jgi:hypothetical protein
LIGQFYPILANFGELSVFVRPAPSRAALTHALAHAPNKTPTPIPSHDHHDASAPG